MTYPLVSELAEDGIPVTVSCRVLKLARQPYYRWRNDPVRDADVLRAHRINALHDAHHDDPTFGYRYLADEARRAGWWMSRRTAWKLCSQAGILSSAQRRRRGKGKKAGPPVFDDHVKRVFRADAPNRVWLTDITEHRTTTEGKLYCCAIKDAFSNRIVGYSIADRMTAKLAVDALRNAVARRGEVAGCILHADRGSQFRSRAMARELRRYDMVGSMGRVGAAGDNAAMESFWSLLQTNVLNQQRWATRQELRLAIVVWIVLCVLCSPKASTTTCRSSSMSCRSTLKSILTSPPCWALRLRWLFPAFPSTAPSALRAWLMLTVSTC